MFSKIHFLFVILIKKKSLSRSKPQPRQFSISHKSSISSPQKKIHFRFHWFKITQSKMFFYDLIKVHLLKTIKMSLMTLAKKISSERKRRKRDIKTWWFNFSFIFFLKKNCGDDNFFCVKNSENIWRLTVNWSRLNISWIF